MFRKLLIVGVIAGGSASLPAIYESNPGLFLDTFGTKQDSSQTFTEEPKGSGPVRTKLVAAEPGRLTGRRVRIDADERGHFQTEFRINGRRIEGMIDTGATLVAINATTARKVGIKLAASDFKHAVETANGQARAAVARIDEIQVGRVTVRDVEAVVLDDDALSGTLVGMSFLKRLDRYQVENGSLLLEQ